MRFTHVAGLAGPGGGGRGIRHANETGLPPKGKGPDESNEAGIERARLARRNREADLIAAICELRAALIHAGITKRGNNSPGDVPN